MAEVALILALGAVGFALARNDVHAEGFAVQPRSTEEHTDAVVHSQDVKGHNNEVPFFGPRVTQALYSGGTDHILDHHTGAGKEYFQKRETFSMYDIKPGTGNPFGQQVETDFEQSRMVTGMQAKNVFPIEQVRVAPGSNAGYTNLGQGGFQQDQMRQWALPPTTDEIRIVSKPKLSYSTDPTPGKHNITLPGIQAPVNKNKPDKFAILGMDRANTAVGAQTAPRLYNEQPMKTQARETTGVEYFGSGGGQEGHWASYIRAFTEPFQEFMKLTAEGRPGPAGAQGTGTSIGGDQYSIQTKKDETVLSDASRFNVPQSFVTPDGQHLGSYRYSEPLQQDVHIERNHPSMVDAHRNNPYTQPLTSF
uniref:Uncharacterized protein n=1 Tax=viral metagenome TaxID=1070528 RepID=A0A6C0B202_9ZZZZ